MKEMNSGLYNGVEYSTMYGMDEKLNDISKNGKYYFHLGGKSEDVKQMAVLAFDVKTDDLVYVKDVQMSEEALKNNDVLLSKYTEIIECIQRECTMFTD